VLLVFGRGATRTALVGLRPIKPAARSCPFGFDPLAVRTMNKRPASVIAAEIGERVMEAADHLMTFAPDLEAKLPFELDGKKFTLTIRRASHG
jgi:hypothetical protein